MLNSVYRATNPSWIPVTRKTDSFGNLAQTTKNIIVPLASRCTALSPKYQSGLASFNGQLIADMYSGKET